jgi:hypothetical protein
MSDPFIVENLPLLAVIPALYRGNCGIESNGEIRMTVSGMDSGLTQLAACQLQLLAINALIEQARGGAAGLDCLRTIQDAAALGKRLEVLPQTVSLQELDDAHADMLYHALMV